VAAVPIVSQTKIKIKTIDGFWVDKLIYATTFITT
jgi:hypothetical protein